jgi:hypothetical protein
MSDVRTKADVLRQSYLQLAKLYRDSFRVDRYSEATRIISHKPTCLAKAGRSTRLGTNLCLHSTLHFTHVFCPYRVAYMRIVR